MLSEVIGKLATYVSVDFLRLEYLDTSVAQWIAAVIVAFMVTSLLRLTTRVMHSRLKEAVPHSDHVWDDIVLDMVRNTYFLFQAAMGVAAASWLLSVPPHWDARIKMMVVLLAILQGAIWASAIVNRFIELVTVRHHPKNNTIRTEYSMIRYAGLAIVWAVASLLVLDNLGVSISTLLAGLGVTGIAVALATQQVMGDLFASLSILLDKPFLLGDSITVDAYSGTVERIGMRSTWLRSSTGERIVFANSDLSKSRIRNSATQKERRVTMGFGLRYDAPAEHIKQAAEIVRTSIQKTPKTRFDRAHWIAFGQDALSFEAVYFVLDGAYNVYMDAHQNILTEILAQFRQNNIVLAEGQAIRCLDERATGT